MRLKAFPTFDAPIFAAYNFTCACSDAADLATGGWLKDIWLPNLVVGERKGDPKV